MFGAFHELLNLRSSCGLSSFHTRFETAGSGARLPESKMATTSSVAITSDAVPRSAISRERTLKQNQGKYKERVNSDPKNKNLYDRLKEFPNEHLCIRNGKLFCDACKEILAYKKSILKNHVFKKAYCW